VVNGRRLVLLLFLAIAVLISPPSIRVAVAAPEHEKDAQVCDPLADYFLGMEDYPEAIRRHVAVIQTHPDNALAYYHLGFAYGMTGRHQDELYQYRKAIDLGLSNWELFLNLGLLYLEERNPAAATDVLQLAVLLAPNRSETHFNLGLAYEHRAMLAPAQQEILLALRLDPAQEDAHNTLGVIYAEMGDYSRAREEWNDLIQTDPDYEPARTNLAILAKAQRGGLKTVCRATNFAQP
jgi:tetratricopeptide (TPR) repeat protein